MADWRFLAQNVLTREWVSTDLPLSDVEVTRELSGPGGISASISPDVLGVTGSGARLLQEWQTAIYAEVDTRIHAGGLLTFTEQDEDGQLWNIECPGFTTYPHGMPYDGHISEWNIDPFVIVRRLWQHLQSYGRGNLRMQVSTASSKARVGDVMPPTRPADVPKQTFKAPKKGAKPKKGKQPKRRSGESKAAHEARVTAWENEWKREVARWEATYKAKRHEYDRNKKAYDKEREQVREAQSKWDELYRERQPYELLWWESPDVGAEIDRLATEAPFDYVERHVWNGDQSDVTHHLDLAHPRLGRRRPELRLAVGENVVIPPDRTRDGEEYANAVIGLGKGEGQKTLRAALSQTDEAHRLRRVAVLAMKDVGAASRLRSLTEAELRRRTALDDVEELVVFDHPNAPLGAIALGDELLLRNESGTVPLRMWVRVESITVRPDAEDFIRLRVKNALKV